MILGTCSKPVRVLFLCTGNYYRSRLAEELLRHHAHQADLEIECDSAGLGKIPNLSNPGPIGIAALGYLRTHGVRSLSVARYPKKWTPSDLQAADFIVCMNEREHRSLLDGQARPFLNHSQVLYWHIPDVAEDPDLMGPELIDQNVRGLLAGLRDGAPARNGRSPTPI